VTTEVSCCWSWCRRWGLDGRLSVINANLFGRCPSVVFRRISRYLPYHQTSLVVFVNFLLRRSISRKTSVTRTFCSALALLRNTSV